jgi:GNAT superfamily N-acetyltransferase
MEQDALPLQVSNIVVRDALLSDAGQILEMIAKLAAHHGDTADASLDQLVRDAFSTRPWIYLLVAEHEGKISGYAALCGLMQLQFGARGLDMHHLFVEAGVRGRGMGAALVKGSIVKARELACQYLAVGTHPDNLQAQAFYVAQAFERRPSYPPRFVCRLDEGR